MENRAIYIIQEKGETAGFLVHQGANALSPLLRLYQAKEIQQKLPAPQSITHIFKHLDYDGRYQNPRLADEDMFAAYLPPDALCACNQSYKNGSLIEMRMLFELDKNGFQMEYNPNCPWYRTMGVFSIDLDVGLENVQKLLTHAGERGITDFDRLLAIYHNSTGLADKLEDARGNMLVSEYMDSPEAEEQRRRYRELADRQAEPDGGSEEMEER